MRCFIQLIQKPFWTQDFHLLDIYQTPHEDHELLQKHHKMLRFSNISRNNLLHYIYMLRDIGYS